MNSEEIEFDMNVIVLDDEGQSLDCVGLPATVIGIIGPFVLLKVNNLGLRASLAKYLKPINHDTKQ